MDWRGEVYAVARITGVRTKEVKDRLGDCADLPTVDDTTAMLAERFTDKHREFAEEITARHDDEFAYLKDRKSTLIDQQRQERRALREAQVIRNANEIRQRAARLPTGIKALWFRLTGHYSKVKAEIETQAQKARERDRTELQALIQRQINLRRRLQTEVATIKFRKELAIKKLNREMAIFLETNGSKQGNAARQSLRRRVRRNQERGPSMQ